MGWSRSMHGRSVKRLQIILQRSEVSGSMSGLKYSIKTAFKKVRKLT